MSNKKFFFWNPDHLFFLTSSEAKISTTNIKNDQHFICIKFETDYLVFKRYFHTFYHSEFDILVKLKLFEIGHCYNKTPEHSKKDTEKREILKGDLNASQIKGKGPIERKIFKYHPHFKIRTQKKVNNPFSDTTGRWKKDKGFLAS